MYQINLGNKLTTIEILNDRMFVVLDRVNL